MLREVAALPSPLLGRWGLFTGVFHPRGLKSQRPPVSLFEQEGPVPLPTLVPPQGDLFSRSPSPCCPAPPLSVGERTLHLLTPWGCCWGHARNRNRNRCGRRYCL